MATTAKQSSTNSTTSTSPSNVRTSQQNFQENGEEDIATIAKQISDHAEAIYQTWKARGLAPTEILNCHTDSSNAFSKTLSPSATGASSTGVGGIITNSNNLNTSVGSTVGGGGIVKSPAVAELLAQAPDLSNNNLEKLVSSFVNEDKARIAAQKQQQQQQQHSGIQYARQKFERAGSSDDTVGNITTASPINTKSNYINRQINLNSNSNNVPDVLKDTIKEQKPYPKEKPQTPVKPEHLLNHVPTWPLKNRLGTNYQLLHQQQQQKNSGVNQLLIGDHSSEMKGQNSTGGAEISTGGGSGIGDGISNNTNGSDSLLLKNSHDLMDEVTREEERLINALKTGTVLNNDTTSLPEVIQSTLINNNNNNNISDINERNNYNLQPDISSSTTNSNNLSNNNNNNSILNNNIDSNNLNHNTTNTTSSTTNNQQVQIKQWNGVPMKPNHTPIILHPKEDTKTYTSFNKVATTRIPTRQEKQMLDESDSKKSFHIKTIPSPIRPFLSRGSVAERVLIFEKCPEKAPPRSTIKETKIQQKVVNKILPPQHSTLQRHLKSSAKNIYIPQFHFPHGKPPPAITTETTMQRLEQTFNKFPNFEISRDKFHMVVTMCQVPLYWRLPLYMCTPLSSKGMVNGNKFMDFWRQMTSFCHDSASRFIYILSRGNRQRPFILPEDLAPLIQDVVDTHPGLAFLKEAAEFHSRYVHTVIARIYYNVNRSWSGKITVPELRKSNLLEVIQLLEEEEDINQIMAYFSYEHFYVIYCKFWELDRDHDLYIDQKDLARHNDHALSSRMIERIFSGCVTRGPKTRNPNGQNNNPKMSYTEFVWFLLAEEDKSHATAIEYWFRCMDVDGDGILSMYELEYFYEEQQHRMDSIGIETLPFEDCLCQMLDMIKPITPGCVTLSDLKRCKMTPIFFDTFFNLEKYMEHEQRDPFAQRDSDDLSDWDRYAAQEYELLVAEEGGDTQGSYDEEDEYESNIDILESHIDDCILNEW